MRKTVRQLYRKMEMYRKPKSSDPYEDRVTHCFLMLTMSDGKEHPFEIRGFRLKVKPTGLEIYVSAVNWTCMAGTCSMHICKELVQDIRFVTVEDYYKGL